MSQDHPGRDQADTVGPCKYRYHSPLISAEWCSFTNFPWGRGSINVDPSEEALAMETYHTWMRLFELQRYYSWIITWLTGGRDGLRDLFRRMLRWRVRPGWWLAAIAPLGLYALVAIALRLIQGQWPDLATLGQIDFCPTWA